MSRNEGEFNAYLSNKAFKPHAPALLTLKVADRFHAGWSDFLLLKGGRLVALEVKWVPHWPGRASTKLLGHAFQGEQLTFFQRVAFAGGWGYGLVAVEGEGDMFLLPWAEIPKTGNWPSGVFRHEMQKYRMRITDADLLVDTIFPPPRY